MRTLHREQFQQKLSSQPFDTAGQSSCKMLLSCADAILATCLEP